MSTSKIKYLGGLRTEATHQKSGNIILTDAPTDNHGKGEAFSPSDLASTAIGLCAITVMGIAAEKAGHEFKGSEVAITKTMTTDAPRRIAKVKVEFSLTCQPALNDDEKRRYERVAKTCPVSLSMHPDIEQEMIFNWQN